MREGRDISFRLLDSKEMHKAADIIESKMGTSQSKDDPKWLKRWATALRKRAKKKERALERRRQRQK